MLTSPSTSTISGEKSVVREAFGTRAVGFFLRWELRERMAVVGDERDESDSDGEDNVGGDIWMAQPERDPNEIFTNRIHKDSRITKPKKLTGFNYKDIICICCKIRNNM
ncbi:hypothetical protein L1887_11128 [Cichorium endivia]|nr:hypothetical protein L1887_11128 [Cichorium endivia]